MMMETYILVPKTYNDGKPVEDEKWEALKMMYLERMGGVTIEKDPKEGLWVDDGTLYEDKPVKYVCAIKSLKQIKDIIEIAEWVRDEWKQECVYVSVAGMADYI